VINKLLTPKQEKFAQGVASGMTQADAYRSAYNVGATTKVESIARKASDLMAEVHIRGRVAELSAPIIAKVGITLENHIARLQELSTKAEAAGQYSAAIKAEESRGKACGLYVEKVQVSGTGEGGAIKTESMLNVSGLSTQALAEIMAMSDAAKSK
jgi:phage terminase small subunit